jgi:acetyl-CoA carboxylase alpha subunit
MRRGSTHNLLRHPKRPYTLDYLNTAFADFRELHGDRLFAEDRAVVGGFYYDVDTGLLERWD